MKKCQVLVIEDDPAIRHGIVDALQFHAYTAIEADNGDDGLDMALSQDYDLLLLDLVLPKLDGFDILKAVRNERPTLPVIVLTARGEESDRVRGLNMGADDYVVKPFSVKELLARVQAVLRRSPERPSDVTSITIADGVVDLSRCEVHFDDGDICRLSEVEAELLRYLVRHAGRAISRDEILSRVWRVNPERVETRTIDMHIVRLREKLRDNPSAPRTIATVRGRGYMLAPRGKMDKTDND